MPYCRPCDRYFPHERALQQHLDNSGVHAYNYECDYCEFAFTNRDALEQHEDEEHRQPAHYCSSCDRSFSNENNLRMHLNSRIHRGAETRCPWCPRSFVTASGLATHLESGACRPGINRDSVYRTIRQRDQQGVITKKQIEWFPGGERYNIVTEASEQSWNGYGYECFLCEREFTMLNGLNNHLNSPVHLQKRYHCPKRGCDGEFVSLAGLVNHFESERCGFMNFSRVQNRIEGLVTGRKRIAF